MEVSKDIGDKFGKSVAIASNTWLWRKLVPRMSRMGIHFSDRVKDLGVELRGAGKREAGPGARAKRFVATAARLIKVQLARKHGAAVRDVVNIGLKPAGTYGDRARG